MKQDGSIAQCEAQNSITETYFTPHFCSRCAHPLVFLFLLSLTAHYSIAKFDVWPPAQAGMERANRAEVSASRRIIIIIIIALGLYISLYDSKNIFK